MLKGERLELEEQQFYTNIHTIDAPDSLTVLVNKFNQLISEYIPKDLELIEPSFNPLGLLLRREARIAFEDMCREGEKIGIHLQAISTFRSFDYQKQVYLKNYTPDIIMQEYQAIRDRVSARAGHSEHQTGLAVDINDLEESFADTTEGRWLAANSYVYGFVLRYPKGKEGVTGYAYEPWHFRYLGKDLAGKVYHSNLTYDEYCVECLTDIE
jgi:D-alanyl-D-alanine carboxypeptidase